MFPSHWPRPIRGAEGKEVDSSIWQGKPNTMFCKCGYWATSRITQYLTCPICSSEILVYSREDQGRYAWFRLHTEENPTREWYENEWKRLIPTYDCQCREKFRRLELARPPIFTSKEEFRQWAIDIHNDVNRELLKPIWVGSIYDAAAMSFAITPAVAE